MEPIRKEFKAFKTKLNNIVITKGKMMINASDFSDPPGEEENIIDIDGFVINHEYNKGVYYNTYTSEFLAVRNELEDNSYSPLISDFEKYLNEIIETYCNFENKIVEDDNGHLSTDLVKFEKCDINTINKHTICNYDQFLEGLKHHLRDDIIYLLGFLDLKKRGYKRIRFLTEINVLGTLFYDLLDKNYIDSTDTNIARFLHESFSDKGGVAINESTIKTILKPGREEKRTNDSTRIVVPDL